MTEITYEPQLPQDKTEPLQEQMDLLVGQCAHRMELYEDERGDMHWDSDYAYRHIERAMGELALVYAMSRRGAADYELRREAADTINHILMALDIGSDDYETKLGDQH